MAKTKAEFTYVHEVWVEHELATRIDYIEAEIDNEVYFDDEDLSDLVRSDYFINKHNSEIDPDYVIAVFEVKREL